MPQKTADTPTQADAAAFAAARSVCRRHAPDFHFAATFLPRRKRDAACAAIAFCHLVAEAVRGRDDACDSPAGPGSSCCSVDSLDQRLSLVRDRLDALYAGGIDLPLPEFRDESQHLLHAADLIVRRHDVPKQYFVDLAAGCQADRRVSRYATWTSLETHCRRTGGAVASIVGCVLGMTHSDAGGQLARLGVAARLTAILRHLERDLARGRIYLPLEDLARFRYSEKDLSARMVNDPLRQLIRFEIDRARGLLRSGSEAIAWLAGDGSRLAAATCVTLNAAVLSSIERRDGNVFTPPPGLTTAQRLRRLRAAWRLARRDPGQPLPEVL